MQNAPQSPSSASFYLPAGVGAVVAFVIALIAFWLGGAGIGSALVWALTLALIAFGVSIAIQVVVRVIRQSR